MSVVRLFIVDDHPIVNLGLVTLLDSPSELGISVVGSASTAGEALDKIREMPVDVVLVDIRLPDFDGIELAKRIKSEDRKVKIIMLTTFPDRESMSAAIEAGADGYLLKEASESMIVASIKSVVKGKMVIFSEKDDFFEGDSTRTRKYNQSYTKNVKDMIGQLTQREQEIFQMLITGKNNTQIADELFISEHTVRNYVSKIYASLNLRNRSAAIQWARENGFF